MDSSQDAWVLSMSKLGFVSQSCAPRWMVMRLGRAGGGGDAERQLWWWVQDGSRVNPPSPHKASVHHLHVSTLGELSFRWGLCDLHRTTWEKPKAQKCADTEAAGYQVAGFSSRTLNNRYQENCIPGPALPLTSCMLPWMLHVPLWDSVFPSVKWKSCKLKQ